MRHAAVYSILVCTLCVLFLLYEGSAPVVEPIVSISGPSDIVAPEAEVESSSRVAVVPAILPAVEVPSGNGLRSGAVVTGQVFSASENARVEVRLEEEHARSEEANPRVAAVDAKGQFRFEGLDPLSRFTVVAEDSSGRQGEATTRPGGHVEIRLSGSCQLAGTLTALPTRGARVFVVVEGGFSVSEEVASSNFRFRNLPRGLALVSFVAPGLAQRFARVRLVEGETARVSFLVDVGKTFSAIVVAEDTESPIARARAVTRWPVRVEESNQAGLLRLDAIPDRPFLLTVSAPGYSSRLLSVTPLGPEKQPTVLVLRREVVLFGRIVASNGQGLENSTVRVRQKVTDGAFGRVTKRQSTVDADGYFRVDGLRYSDWDRIHVFVVAPGKGTRSFVVRASKNEVDLGEVHLCDPVSVSGRVFGQHSRPVDRAFVSARPTTTGIWGRCRSRATADWQPVIAGSTTNANGAFELAISDCLDSACPSDEEESRRHYAVSVSAEGFQRWRKVVPFSSLFDGGLQIELLPLRPVRGIAVRVVNEWGEPIVGTKMDVYVRQRSLALETDQEGLAESKIQAFVGDVVRTQPRKHGYVGRPVEFKLTQEIHEVELTLRGKTRVLVRAPWLAIEGRRLRLRRSLDTKVLREIDATPGSEEFAFSSVPPGSYFITWDDLEGNEGSTALVIDGSAQKVVEIEDRE